MTRRSKCVIQFALVIVVASASGLLLGAQPPQPVATWTSMGVVADARQSAASVSLPDGSTLILGGVRADGSPTDTVVVFDPLANTVTPIGYLSAARIGHTATLLDDGRVLIAGGTVDGMISADVEVFDPSSGNSTPMALLAQPRAGHAAARLVDGRILIVGGTTLDGVVLASAELIAPVAGSIVPLAETLHEARTRASATTLIDGRVLIVGGTNGSSELATAEIFEPASQAFTPVDTQLSVARSAHAAVLLPHNAGVLIAGGTASGAAVVTADLFLPAEFPDPFSYGIGTFASTGPLTAARTGAVGGPAGDAGYAFVAGGGSQTAEKYRYATIRTDKEDYAPGEFAVIMGSGWQPGEDVRLLFQEDPAVHPDYVVTVTADPEGNVYWDQWAPEEHDLNVRFYLLASDSRSRAQTTFTDGRLVVASVSAIGSSANITYGFFAGNATCTGTATPTTILLADGATHTVAGQMGSNQSVRLVAAAAATDGAAFAHWTVTVIGGNPINVDLTQPTLCVPGQGGTGNNNQGTYTYTAVYTAAANTPPSVNAGGDGAINEGTAFAQLGSLTDPDADVWTATVDYGDGTGSQPLALNPDKTFALGHTYADNGSYTVTVTVTDDDGGVGSDTILVTVDNVAPTVTTLVMAPEPSNEGSAATASATFSDPGTNDAPFTCTVDYGDGSGPQAGTVTGNLCEGPAHTYADNGSYTVLIAVTDKDGGTESNSTTHAVENLAPTIKDVTNNGPVNEGSPVFVTMTASDPAGGNDPLSYAFDCNNDSTYDVGPQSDNTGSCTFNDNGLFTIGVQVSDDDGGMATGSTTVIVKNVAPAINGGSDATVDEGALFGRGGSFSDPGADSWTAIVDYGDGTGSRPLALNPDKTFALGHTYTDNGSYTVTVTVTDDDGGVGSDTIQVTVNNVAPAVATPAVTPEPSNEGSAATASATFSDPGTNDAPFTCTVDYGDGSGPQPGTVTGNTCEGPVHTYADNGSYAIMVAVTDKDGGTGSNTTTHAVNNVAPTGTLGNNGPVNEGSPVTIGFAGEFDPSSADTWAGFRYTYSCTNDVSALATTYATATTSPSTTCMFGDNGSYPVIGRIFDKDSGYTDYTTTVTVSNVAPSFAGHTFTFNPYTGTASASVTFSDSGWLDLVSSTFSWTGVSMAGTPNSQGPGSAPALSGTFSSSYVFGSGCITNAIGARVMDDDAGYFEHLFAAADTLGVYSVTFLAPVKDGIRNVVKHGNVIPIKVSIRDCKGNAVTGKTLTIALVAGIVAIEDIGNGTEEIVPTSVSAADSTGVMRAVDSHYMYNMATKGLTIGLPHTIVIRDGTQIIATAVVDTKK